MKETPYKEIFKNGVNEKSISQAILKAKEIVHASIEAKIQVYRYFYLYKEYGIILNNSLK